MSVVFLDLTKAFDTVDHDILLAKLSGYGIRNNELTLFKNYLTDRGQVVVIDSVQSNCNIVTHGVPQGSILGPLLFIIFINDLPSVISQSKIVLNADDTAILYSAKHKKEIENTLNQELVGVADWMYLHKLTLNVSKSKVMLFGSPQKTNKIDSFEVELNCDILETVTEFKYLGIWYDRNLKWNRHIDVLGSKIAQKLGVIKRLRQFVDKYTLQILYNTLVLPHIDYCLPVWSNTSLKYLNKIQILQNRAARMVLGCQTRDMHVGDLYEKLGWMTVRQRSLYFNANLMYNCVNGLAPVYLSTTVQSNIGVHTHNTRQNSKNNIAFNMVNSDSGKRMFQYSGGQIWNNLPFTLRQSPSQMTFKLNLKKHILA